MDKSEVYWYQISIKGRERECERGSWEVNFLINYFKVLDHNSQVEVVYNITSLHYFFFHSTVYTSTGRKQGADCIFRIFLLWLQLSKNIHIPIQCIVLCGFPFLLTKFFFPTPSHLCHTMGVWNKSIFCHYFYLHLRRSY